KILQKSSLQKFQSTQIKVQVEGVGTKSQKAKNCLSRLAWADRAAAFRHENHVRFATTKCQGELAFSFFAFSGSASSIHRATFSPSALQPSWL
ncbi:MAG: hypothetical protein JW888_16220, partial [Pirellulales bacterium]|nr:hypothetical protein [Pirellulales bacterium]